LANHETWSSQGIPGLLSPQGYSTAWTNYQTYLLTNLTLLTNGTANETKKPFEILLNTAKQTTQQHTFFSSTCFNIYMLGITLFERNGWMKSIDKQTNNKNVDL